MLVATYQPSHYLIVDLIVEDTLKLKKPMKSLAYSLKLAERRADKLRDKLGWRGGILHGSEPWNKPKGMHWKTFEQLCAKHDAFAKSSMTGMVTKFNLAGESWEDWV